MEIGEQLIEKLQKIPKIYYVPLSVGCIGLILFVYGIWTIVSGSHSRENTEFYDFSQDSPSQSAVLASNSAHMPIIVVDVEGAVVRPGVYDISQSARVQDALVAAGGLSGNADRAWVAQHINLATKVTDGTKVYIPSYAEAQEGKASQISVGISTSDSEIGTQNSGAININSATATDLDTLPGVGAATANKIIASRPYSSVQDLLTKKVVSQKEFTKIENLISTN